MKNDEEIGKKAADTARLRFLADLEEKKVGTKIIVTRLKQALNAKKTQNIKMKGAISQSNLPNGVKLIATSGLIVENDDGEIYGNGESIIAVNMIDNRTRLDAVKELVTILDLRPSEKHDLNLSGNIEYTEVAKQLLDEVDGATRGIPSKDS